MANNRLYLICPIEGDALFLGKYYPENWSIGEWTDDICSEMRRFFYEHRHAHDQDMQFGERDGQFPFPIVTEGQLGSKLAKEKRGILNAASEAFMKSRSYLRK